MSLSLSMIVKNEEHVIARCLRSVKPFIDYYSISDTGSTDNTMEIIRKELDGIPGVLISDAWQDFGTNRNLALSRAVGSHVLTIDADEVLEHHGGPLVLDPEFDGFWFQSVKPYMRQWLLRIVRNDPRWKWHYKLHEVLMFDGEAKSKRIENFTVKPYDDSDRNRLGDKFERDLRFFEGEPATQRNVFYHAQTLYMLKRYDEATKKYYERAALGGWEQEVYYSLYRAGETMRLAKRPLDETAGALYRAYTYRPNRLEALVSLCFLLREHKRWLQIYNLTSIDPKFSDDTLFVDAYAHWLILEEHAVAAYWLGKYEESRKYFLRVAEHDLPGEARERTRRNLSLPELSSLV